MIIINLNNLSQTAPGECGAGDSEGNFADGDIFGSSVI